MIRKGQKTTWRVLLVMLMALAVVGGLFTAQPAAAAPTGEGIDIGNMGNTTEPAEGISPDGTRVCAVWTTFDLDPNKVYVRIYNTITDTFSPSSPYQLSEATNTGKAHCAIDGAGNTHVVWQQCSSGECQIAYRRLPAGADPSNGWTSLNSIEFNRDGPDIDALYADTNGQVWLAYRQYPGSFQVRYWKNGSWSSAQTISADPNSEKVRIGVDNAGFVSLTWRDGNNGAAYAYRDPSSGQFSTKYVIPGSNGAGISSLAVDRDNGDIHIAYSKSFTELHYAKGGRGGTNFSDRQIATATSQTLSPRIAWSANGRIIIAFDNNNKAMIDVITSENRGGNWGGITTVARPGGGAEAPWIVADSNGAGYIVYAHRSGSAVYFTTIAGTGGGTTPPSTNPGTTIPVISNVSATPSTLTSETITWTTDVASSSRVFYSVNGVALDTTCTLASCTAGNADFVTNHAITLRGLAPNTTYTYQVRSTNAAGERLDPVVRTFTTVSLEIVGNNRTYNGKFSALVYKPAGVTRLTWRTTDGTASGSFSGTSTTKPQVVAFSGDLTPTETQPRQFSVYVFYDGQPNTVSTTATIMYNQTYRSAFSDVDVNSTSPFAVAIYELQGRGIVQGSDGQFRPIAPIARAEAAVIVTRALGWNTESGANSFSDIAVVDAELQNAVRVLADYGVARGFGDGTYQPIGSITQAQIVSLVTRSMVAKGYWQYRDDDGSFPEVPVSSGHRQDLVTFNYYTSGVLSQFFSGANYASDAERRFVARVVYEAVKWRENQASGASLYELP